MSAEPKPDSSDECVRVMVRCRPMNDKERDNGSKNVIEIDKTVNQVIIQGIDVSANDQRAFTYDAVYGSDSTQR